VNRPRRIGLTSRSLAFAVALHGLVALLLVVNIYWGSDDATPLAAREVEPIKANVVAETEIDQELDKLRQKEEEKKQQELERRQQLEELEKQRKAEEAKLAELEQRKKQAEEEAKQAEEEAKQAEAKQKTEQERLVKLEQEKQRKAEEEKKKKQEAERQRKLAEEKNRKEEQARKLAEEKKRKEEAERKRKEEEARRLAEAERVKREQEVQAQLETQRNAQQAEATFTSLYLAAIQQKVSRNWLRPPTSKVGLTATVLVSVTLEGEVINAEIERGSGDPVFDRSVINAVLKASPLPFPQDPRFYETLRTFRFKFKPDQQLVS